MVEGEAEGLDGCGGPLAAADQRVAAGSLIVAAPALADAVTLRYAPAVIFLTELDASYLDHRQCGELEARVEGPMVRIADA